MYFLVQQSICVVIVWPKTLDPSLPIQIVCYLYSVRLMKSESERQGVKERESQRERESERERARNREREKER